MVAFIGDKGFSFIKHALIPILGLIVNVVMVLAIFIIGIMSGGITTQATYLALGISFAWLAISVTYFIVNSSRRGEPILPSVQQMTKEP
jgi:hypothetical protein